MSRVAMLLALASFVTITQRDPQVLPPVTPAAALLMTFWRRHRVIFAKTVVFTGP